MAQYSSYYTYQKYVKYGNQDWVPSFPLEYSVSGDSENPMPLVIKLSADTACGYVPPVEYEYRDVESGYTCVGYDKYTRIVRQRSSDGINWQNVSTSAGTLIQENSTDCGYVGTLYRWVNSGTTCYQGNKYIRIVQQVSNDGINWSNTGVESRGTMVESASTDCIEYRWVNMDISTDWVCSGTSKYYKQKKQYSTDGGATWYDVVPAEYQIGALYEEESVDCGYVPPYDGKLKALYSDTSEYIVSCNTSTTLTQSEVRGHSTPYSSMTDAIIGSCVTSFVNPQPGQWSSGAFRGCSSLTSVTIPNSVTSIDNYTFYHCSGITNCTISQNSNLTTIGLLAFGDCSGLTSINIPSGVTSIGNRAFQNCNSLASVTIPSGVTSVGDFVFQDCSSLTSFTFEQGSQLTNLGINMLVGDYNLTNIVIPSGVTSMTGTFQDCSGLTSVTFEQGSQLKSIRQSAFYRCYGLTNIDIPNSVTEIGYGVFNECSGLTSITIGSGVTTIDEMAFYQCNSLQGITIKATTPPTLASPGSLIQSNDCPIYVPSGSVNAYKSATYWSYYAGRIQAIP